MNHYAIYDLAYVCDVWVNGQDGEDPTVLVFGRFCVQGSVALARGEEVEEGECRLCVGSLMMFSAHFLVLPEYKYWREGIIPENLKDHLYL